MPNQKQYRESNNSAKITEMDTNRTTQRINEKESCLFGKLNKIDKPLIKLMKRVRTPKLIKL
jgi:hypothetical protein